MYEFIIYVLFLVVLAENRRKVDGNWENESYVLEPSGSCIVHMVEDHVYCLYDSPWSSTILGLLPHRIRMYGIYANITGVY